MRFILLFLVFVTSFSAQVNANQFTAKNFLGFSEGQREWWYMGSIDALGLVVSQSNKKQADCIWNWYFADKNAKTALLDAKMKEYPSHSPSAVIMGLLYKNCGEFSVQGGQE